LDTPSYQFALLFNIDQFPLKFTKNPFVFTVTSWRYSVKVLT